MRVTTDWWGVSATIFAAASLIAVAWQILRFELVQPAFAWQIYPENFGDVVDGRQSVRVSFKPLGPVVIHEVESNEWGNARCNSFAERARMDCESEAISVEAVWVPGTDAYVGYSWLEPALMRRAPIRHAIRYSLNSCEVELWHWYRIPRLGRFRQGKWRVYRPRQPRRTHVPDMWGMPGSK